MGINRDQSIEDVFCYFCGWKHRYSTTILIKAERDAEVNLAGVYVC